MTLFEFIFQSSEVKEKRVEKNNSESAEKRFIESLNAQTPLWFLLDDIDKAAALKILNGLNGGKHAEELKDLIKVKSIYCWW